MPDRRSARLLAPLALVVFVVVLVMLISSTGGDGSKSSTTKGNRTVTTRARPRPKPRSYVVKSSDTSLDSIARKTGVPTDRLLSLNPALDPQTLVPGQRIKLRP
jgi:LysM repeat protein